MRRRCVSSPDKIPRKELKIRRAAEYVWRRTSRCFIWWCHTVPMLDITSQLKWFFFYQKKLRMQKLAVFHLILNTYQTLISFVFSLWIIDEFEKKISNKLHRGACRNCIKTWKGSPELFQVSVHVQPCHLLNRGQKKKTVSVPKYTGSLK